MLTRQSSKRSVGKLDVGCVFTQRKKQQCSLRYILYFRYKHSRQALLTITHKHKSQKLGRKM